MDDEIGEHGGKRHSEGFQGQRNDRGYRGEDYLDFDTNSQGYMSFLLAAYTYTAVFVLLYCGLLAFFTDVLTTIGRVVGALTSIMFS